MARQHFTYLQIATLLEKQQVIGVFKDGSTGKVALLVREAGGLRTSTVPELKARLLDVLKDMDEQRKEILENHFAEPMVSEVSMAEGARMKVSFLKTDGQLTPAEVRRKRDLLSSVDRNIRNVRKIVAALNYLQVHATTLLPLFAAPERKRDNPGPDGRLVWTRGVTSAALQCRNELKAGGTDRRNPLEVCRSFLLRYAIQGEPMYTPERLRDNVLRLLARDGR